MSSTNFVAFQTPINADWLNDVDASTYQGQLDDGSTRASIDKYLPSGTGAVATTVQTKLRESVSVLDFGADPTGAANSTTAFQNAYNSLGPTNGRLIIPAGVYLVQGWLLDKSGITIECFGELRPVSNTSTPIVTIGSVSNVFGIYGNLNLNTNGTFATWGSTVGVSFVGLNQANLVLRTVGFGTNILMAPSSLAVAYNNFYLEDCRNAIIGLDINPSGTGYVNENQFFGGRFGINSSTYNNATPSIYVRINNSGANVPNNNTFYSPSFEGDGQYVSIISGQLNNFINCRAEATLSGTEGVNYSASLIYVQGSSKWNVLEFSMNQNTASTAYMRDLGVATRLTDYSFTLVGDQTSWCYGGANIALTIGGTTYTACVQGSNFAATTTVYITTGICTGNSTNSWVPRFRMDNAAIPNIIELREAGVTGASSRDASLKVWQAQRINMVRSALYISSMDSQNPALTLGAGASGTDEVLRILNFGTKSLGVDGTGAVRWNDSEFKLFRYTTNILKVADSSGAGSIAFTATGSLGSGTWAAASALGTLSGKITITDGNGNVKGYMPVYTTIT